jgi:hypothetical protein
MVPMRMANWRRILASVGLGFSVKFSLSNAIRRIEYLLISNILAEIVVRIQ